MKPFDLEAAKRGEPIEYVYSPIACKAHYIGQSAGGFPVIQKMSGGGPFSCEFSALFMAPKKVTVRYRTYIWKSFEGVMVATLNNCIGYKTPEQIEVQSGFLSWIHTEWQTAEIQGDE